ncbi:MAG: pyruvate dehydrogenase complex dihydrolipoamide acetyltransferase [Bacteroidia bacterium]|nr:pyruvate dehydrogenase complex dihydrolipoamide acetyltransferase [Bacteroidia bacterium]MDW8159568.1 pyruvate dehydrogenase complex dihydrolipoamide acetyltransferase [Bacteroidia bacterium]
MAEIIEMPKMTDTMTEGVLVAWHKKVGDKVKAGDILAEVETDKATMELESYFDGYLLYIGVEAGSTVAIGQLVAIIGKQDEDITPILEKYSKKVDKSTVSQEVAAEAPISAAAVNTAQQAHSQEVLVGATVGVAVASDDRIKASPLAKALAKEKGIELSSIVGTGEGGRIIKRDIESFKPAAPIIEMVPPASVLEAGPYVDVPLTQMRKTIARRLSESKNTAPHYYLTMAIRMDKAAEFREQIKNDSGTKISYNDMIIKAAALALKKHPKVNASWLGESIRQYNYYNIGMAVAMEEGLIVPVIKNADAKGLIEISNEARLLSEKARNKQLQPQEYQGNTFTISNLGMYGIEEFTAIINPPDVCILAVGAINEQPVVENGQITIGKIMKVTLSCDHRVVDGAVGSEFLQTLKYLLENPIRMLL